MTVLIFVVSYNYIVLAILVQITNCDCAPTPLRSSRVDDKCSIAAAQKEKHVPALSARYDDIPEAITVNVTYRYAVGAMTIGKRMASLS